MKFISNNNFLEIESIPVEVYQSWFKLIKVKPLIGECLTTFKLSSPTFAQLRHNCTNYDELTKTNKYKSDIEKYGTAIHAFIKERAVTLATTARCNYLISNLEKRNVALEIQNNEFAEQITTLNLKCKLQSNTIRRLKINRIN